jgi:general secretion pathway protein G
VKSTSGLIPPKDLTKQAEIKQTGDKHMRETLREKRGSGGFTLVELLITIVIIGILAAVVVLAVGGLTNTGEESACNASKDAAHSAATAYYADQTPPAWPTTWAQITPTYMTPRGSAALNAGGQMAGSGWVLTVGAGGANETTFTCSFP